MSFLRRAVAKGARHAAMRVQKTTTTTTAHIGTTTTTTTTSSKTTTRRRLFTSASSSPSSSFAPRTHGAKRMAENVMVHKRSFRSGDGNPSSSFKTGMSSSGGSVDAPYDAVRPGSTTCVFALVPAVPLSSRGLRWSTHMRSTCSRAATLSSALITPVHSYRCEETLFTPSRCRAR